MNLEEKKYIFFYYKQPPFLKSAYFHQFFIFFINSFSELPRMTQRFRLNEKKNRFHFFGLPGLTHCAPPSLRLNKLYKFEKEICKIRVKKNAKFFFIYGMLLYLSSLAILSLPQHGTLFAHFEGRSLWSCK